jgi:hypothetical protein
VSKQGFAYGLAKLHAKNQKKKKKKKKKKKRNRL